MALGKKQRIAKHSSKWVSYLRVSTDKQGASGLGLEAQRKAVADYLNGGKWTLAKEFVEIESGKRSDRPKLAEALALCKKLKAKLIVAKLDRLGRNVHFLSGLMESGVDFVAVDQPFANKLTIHILAAVAEHEREMISTRTRDALAAAKARGVKLGGPKLAEVCRIGHRTQAEQADRFAANTRPVIEQIRKSGITSLRAIAAALNARGCRLRAAAPGRRFRSWRLSAGRLATGNEPRALRAVARYIIIRNAITILLGGSVAVRLLVRGCLQHNRGGGNHSLFEGGKLGVGHVGQPFGDRVGRKVQV